MKMNVPFVDLQKQYLSLKNEIDGAVSDVLKGGHYILGESVKKFEDEFAAYCGARYAVGVNSGTDALLLSLVACGIKRGDEVITVANTFFATAEAISHSGAKPVFVDIDERTFNIDAGKIEERITRRTRAIIPVHLYGHPADMSAVTAIAEKHKLKVIEDACQAAGAKYRLSGKPHTSVVSGDDLRGKWKPAGSMGDCGCFSFVPAKNLGGYGDGGMVVTDNPEIAEKIKQLRNHGSAEKYLHGLVGYNSRLDEIQAAILRIKLKKLDKWNSARREIAGLYGKLLENTGLVLPVEKKGARHIFHLYVVRSRNRQQLQKFLNLRGISTIIHYPVPISRQAAYRGFKRTFLPVTERCTGEILSLPVFPEMSEAQARYVCGAVRDFYSKKCRR
ncbi:MAG: DegT/DnrJ/EryC1/StrS family aminotransferase [bacterium]